MGFALFYSHCFDLPRFYKIKVKYIKAIWVMLDVFEKMNINITQVLEEYENCVITFELLSKEKQEIRYTYWSIELFGIKHFCAKKDNSSKIIEPLGFSKLT